MADEAQSSKQNSERDEEAGHAKEEQTPLMVAEPAAENVNDGSDTADAKAALSEATETAANANEQQTAPTSQSQTASSVPTSPAPKTFSPRVTQIDDEPYDFDKSTLLVTMQLMPEDDHQDGREVALTINTHNDIPILKLVRLKELEPLPPWLQALLDEIREAMPSYAADAERRKEEEKAIKRAASAKTSSTSAKNLKANAGKKGATAATAPKPSDSMIAPVFEDQGSLFNLMTGQRPKNNETATAGGGQ